MARKARKDLEGKYFHIMVQGIGKEMIFPDNNSKGYYIEKIKEAKVKNKIFIFAFCIMGNHAHLLLKGENVKTVSLFMKGINTEYARYYNNMKHRIGYVFRGRYKSEIIEDAKYLINCLAYIHNNPVKAKIVNKAEEYSYSSYNNYLNGSGIVDFVEAKNYYDISAANIKAIMKEKSHSDWMEHDDKEYEEYEKVIDELVKKYSLSKNSLEEDDLLSNVVLEIRERTGLSLRKIADLLVINRERIRSVIRDKR